MIDYQKILDKNLINVFKDILNYIKKNGLGNKNYIYITFLTNNKLVKMPNWLKKKYPTEMTIIIQYEYYDIQIFDDYFSIILSFDDIKTKLEIDFNAIISFADPSSNFGLKLNGFADKKNIDKVNIDKVLENKDNHSKENVVEFANYKKLT